MKGFVAALWVEMFKIRKSKILYTMLITFVSFGIIMGFLMIVVMHPEIAGRSTALQTKSSFISSADWIPYLGLFLQSILTIGVMCFGIAASWIFGREYADRVVKDLLAVQVSRAKIVLAKFLVLFVWCILLSLALILSGLLMGAIINLHGWDAGQVKELLSKYIVASFLVTFLTAPMAFIASATRGYLASIGASIAFLTITQLVFVGIPELTPYFPWALPALHLGLAGQLAPNPTWLSYVLYGITCIGGIVATVLWWQHADQA